MKILLCVPIILLLAAGGAFSQSRAEALRGLSAIAVDASVHGDSFQGGLNVDQLKSDTELQLRKAGIRIMEAGASSPRLYVRVTSINIGGGRYVSDVEVQLLERAVLKRKPTEEITAFTWATGEMLIAESETDLRRVRDHISDIVNTFANDYLRVNAK